MTTTAPPQPPTIDHETLGAILGPVHEQWLPHVRRAVEPAARPGAGFWDRWSATRYLGDQFGDHYQHEDALLEQVLPLMPAAEASELLSTKASLDLAREQLEHVGRRRGTANEVAAISRYFLDTLERWCADFARAARHVLVSDLPAGTEVLLARLQASAAGRP